MSRFAEEARKGGRDHHDDSYRPARRSSSPAYKRRAVAADYFEEEDNNDDNNTQSRSHTHTRDHRHHRHRDAEGHDGRREHKRRKHHHDSSSASKRHDPNTVSAPAELPFKSRPLSSKHDLDAFEPLFAYYLDIQKGKDFYSLDSYEQKGRWKSFVNKWNRGALAEGWYDPEMFERVANEVPERDDAPLARNARSDAETDEARDDVPELLSRGQRYSNNEVDDDDDDDNDDDDDYGPPPPPDPNNTRSTSRKGPGIPSLADLALKREAEADANAARLSELRLARKADRAQQKDALDELVPRAEAGTRERKLEKKAAVNDKMRSFREKGDAMVEVEDGELMGGGDGVAEFKRAVASQQRKKTERELRREEEARARREEREEKLKEWKAREEEKMKGLKELAKARFG